MVPLKVTGRVPERWRRRADAPCSYASTQRQEMSHFSRISCALNILKTSVRGAKDE